MSTDISTSKLRQHFRQLRRQLSPSEQTEHALLLGEQLRLFFSFKHPARVAAYIATQGEISLNPWIAGTSRHQLYLPKLYEPLEPRLRFAPLNANTKWVRNRFDILEPGAHWGQALHPRLLDIVLMPLVAFDRQGLRLGMGGGYYDRSLAFRRDRRHWQKPLLIGVAHSCQEYSALPQQSWDVPLDLIITEREIIQPD